MPSSQVHFGAVIRDQRLKAGLGLREFAEMIGVLPSNLAHVEAGRRKPFKDRIHEMAVKLGIPPNTEQFDEFVFEGLNASSQPLPNREAKEFVYGLCSTIRDSGLSSTELKEVIDVLNRQL